MTVDLFAYPQNVWSQCWVCGTGQMRYADNDCLECDDCGHREAVR